MEHTEWIDTVDELRERLADTQPTIVVLPPLGMPTQAMAEICQMSPNARVDLGAWPNLTYPVLAFHQATVAFSPARKGDLTNRRANPSSSASRRANRESR
jgi:hypothetical protein